MEEHNNNVVMLLQSKLASTSMTFKDVLEVRTQVRYILLGCRLELMTGLATEHERVERSYGAVRLDSLGSDAGACL